MGAGPVTEAFPSAAVVVPAFVVMSEFAVVCTARTLEQKVFVCCDNAEKLSFLIETSLKTLSSVKLRAQTEGV